MKDWEQKQELSSHSDQWSLIKPNVTLMIIDDDDNDCTMYNVMIKNDKYLLKLLAIEVFWGWDDFRITAFPDWWKLFAIIIPAFF